MKILGTTRLAAQIELSPLELLFISNCLNEVCNGIDIPEFETRLGVSTKFAETFHDSIKRVFETMSDNP